MTTYSPRSGFSEVFIKWKLDAHNLAKALEINPDALYTETGPPQLHNLETVTRSSSKSAAELDAVLQEQQREWLIANTSFYWHLKESLDLDGHRLVQDRTFVDSLASDNKLADGRGLFRWASDFAESTDTGINSSEAQQEILKKLLNTKLKPGSTCAQIDTHLQNMLSLWQLIVNNKTAEPESYWMYIRESIPTEEGKTNISSLRAWLALTMSNKSPVLNDIQKGIDAMLKHAHHLGIPQGKIEKVSSVLNSLGANASCELCDQPAAGKRSSHVHTRPHRYGHTQTIRDRARIRSVPTHRKRTHGLVTSLQKPLPPLGIR